MCKSHQDILTLQANNYDHLTCSWSSVDESYLSSASHGRPLLGRHKQRQGIPVHLQVLQVAASFVSQLEGLKLPQWAVYVALHLPDSPRHAGLRRQVVRELLFRWAAELHAA